MQKLAGTLLAAVLLGTTGCASFAVGVGSSEPAPAPTRPSKGPKKTLGIPPGHFPPPGQCRVWHPGSPPGHQPKPGPCDVVERQVRRGDWLVFRPGHGPKVIRVYVYDGTPAVRVATRTYDSRSGEYLGDR